jgi:3-phenylpropionate/trans-cinnamate dioxygenase ferredoxin component
MTLTKLCSIRDVPVGQARRFALADGWVAVVNLGDDGFRAVDAICSHEHFFLDDGEVDVDDHTIECAKHGSTFDLETGNPRTLPAVRPVAVYDVKIDNDDILIEV